MVALGKVSEINSVWLSFSSSENSGVIIPSIGVPNFVWT